jgi:hypothetical protein
MSGSLFKILFCLMSVWVISCTDIPKKSLSAGKAIDEEGIYNTKATHCLRNFLIGEDCCGVWSIVLKPAGSTLVQADLDGSDSPCIDFGLKGCGLYRLQYKITDPCCPDSTTINITKRCCQVTGVLICN